MLPPTPMRTLLLAAFCLRCCSARLAPSEPSCSRWTSRPARATASMPRRPSTAADKDLDRCWTRPTGGSAFSTDELERVEKALRRFLDAARPRAMPRLLLFLYPGRISRISLKELREVKVDIELLVDPCSRTVCADSVGKTLELVGRSLRQAVLRTSRYTVRFGTVTIRTSPRCRPRATTCIVRRRGGGQAGQRAGGGGGAGLAPAAGQRGLRPADDPGDGQADEGCAGCSSASRPPCSARPRSVSVDLEIKSDRVRYKSEVLAALLGTAEALRKSPLTPPQPRPSGWWPPCPFAAVERRSFRCTGQPLCALCRRAAEPVRPLGDLHRREDQGRHPAQLRRRGGQRQEGRRGRAPTRATTAPTRSWRRT